MFLRVSSLVPIIFFFLYFPFQNWHPVVTLLHALSFSVLSACCMWLRARTKKRIMKWMTLIRVEHLWLSGECSTAPSASATHPDPRPASRCHPEHITLPKWSSHLFFKAVTLTNLKHAHQVILQFDSLDWIELQIWGWVLRCCNACWG